MPNKCSKKVTSVVIIHKTVL